MREILFRGKRIDNGEWVYGCLLDKIYGAKPAILTLSYIDDAVCLEFDYDHVDPETIGQYTGLTDKNGKRIFEGDVCTNHKGDIGRVTWYEEHCAFMIYSITENKVYWLFDNDFSLIEVIGNIHDSKLEDFINGG